MLNTMNYNKKSVNGIIQPGRFVRNTIMFVSKYRKLCLCLVSWLCCCCVVVASSESNINPKDHDQTPTWVVACVCTVFILISITLEKSLHKVGIVCHHFQTFIFFSLLICMCNYQRCFPACAFHNEVNCLFAPLVQSNLL